MHARIHGRARTFPSGPAASQDYPDVVAMLESGDDAAFQDFLKKGAEWLEMKRNWHYAKVRDTRAREHGRAHACTCTCMHARTLTVPAAHWRVRARTHASIHTHTHAWTHFLLTASPGALAGGSALPQPPPRRPGGDVREAQGAGAAVRPGLPHHRVRALQRGCPGDGGLEDACARPHACVWVSVRCAYAHAHAHTRTSAHAHTCKHTRAYAHMHAITHTHTHIRTHTHTCRPHVRAVRAHSHPVSRCNSAARRAFTARRTARRSPRPRAR